MGKLSFTAVYEQLLCVGIVLDPGVAREKDIVPTLKVSHRLVVKKTHFLRQSEPE